MIPFGYCADWLLFDFVLNGSDTPTVSVNRLQGILFFLYAVSVQDVGGHGSTQLLTFVALRKFGLFTIPPNLCPVIRLHKLIR